MIEKIKSLNKFILRYYNSILLCLISLWLAFTLISVGHSLLAVILIAMVIVKLTVMITDQTQMRKVGIIGLNALWNLTAR